jgi:hypothetical protein
LNLSLFAGSGHKKFLIYVHLILELMACMVWFELTAPEDLPYTELLFFSRVITKPAVQQRFPAQQAPAPDLCSSSVQQPAEAESVEPLPQARLFSGCPPEMTHEPIAPPVHQVDSEAHSAP